MFQSVPSMSNEPYDRVVEDAIFEQCSRFGKVRPNKLRKEVCKIVETTNWTQFQRVLDNLVQLGKVDMCDEGGHKIISLLSSNVETTSLDEEETFVECDSIDVPIQIVLNLVRKGKKKQTNIEKNTKTFFKYEKNALIALRKVDFDHMTNTSLTITSARCHDVESAAKYVKTARVMVEKMIEAFQKNPSRFSRKAGGTFAEQYEEKKRKAGVKTRHKKHDDEKSERNDSLNRKKKRKFY